MTIIPSGEQKFDWYTTSIADIVDAVKTSLHTTGKRAYVQSLKRGMRHERGVYTGLLDRIAGFSSPKYSLEDVRRGYVEEKIMCNGNTVCLGIEKKPVEPPTNPYWIGRYMQQADRLFACSEERGDVGTALEGLRLYRWLNQDDRIAVKQKMRRVYGRAQEIAEQHGVPISDPLNRKMAVLPSSVNREAVQYLARD